MKKVIFDCDNTLGVIDCDVDDGLALMYLLGCPDAEILGITATYGNNRLDIVMGCIQKMLGDLGRTDIPVKKGGAVRGEYDSEATDFLVETVNKYPGEVSILATGSLTNLGGAYRKDNTFFDKVKEIVLMGGITSPLVFEKKIMDELNFSCDPAASYDVLTKGNNVSIATGNNCLKVLFAKEEYKTLFRTGNAAAEYIQRETDYYFQYNENDYGIKGFYNWDVTAAVYLMHPELFADCKKKFKLSEEDLESGFLRECDENNCVLNLPEIGEEQLFKKNIYDTWMNVKM